MTKFYILRWSGVIIFMYFTMVREHDIDLRLKSLTVAEQLDQTHLGILAKNQRDMQYEIDVLTERK